MADKAYQELAKDAADRQRDVGHKRARERAARELAEGLAVGAGILARSGHSYVDVKSHETDYEPDDLLLDPNGPINRVRTIHGFKVERRTEYGLWAVVDGPPELSGSYTSQELVTQAIEAYLKSKEIKIND